MGASPMKSPHDSQTSSESKPNPMSKETTDFLQEMIYECASMDAMLRSQKLAVDEELAFVNALHAIDHLAQTLAKKRSTDDTQK